MKYKVPFFLSVMYLGKILLFRLEYGATVPHPFSLIMEFSSVQFSSVTQSCPTLCNLITCNTPGLPAHHQLLELTQAHVHRVSDAIQPSHPLLSPSPLTFNLSQHQYLFK